MLIWGLEDYSPDNTSIVKPITQSVGKLNWTIVLDLNYQKFLKNNKGKDDSLKISSGFNEGSTTCTASGTGM